MSVRSLISEFTVSDTRFHQLQCLSYRVNPASSDAANDLETGWAGKGTRKDERH